MKNSATTQADVPLRRQAPRPVLMLCLLLCTLFMASGCVSLAEYQKMRLNDPDMVLSDKTIESFEQGFVTYREGTSGGNGGKTGGGCGCN